MAIEDWTTYTETDPGADLTVTSDLIDANAVPPNLDTYVHKDMDADHFGATFEHLVEVTFITSSPTDREEGNYGRLAFWGVSNQVNDCNAWTSGAYAAIYCEDDGTRRFYLQSKDVSSVDSYNTVNTDPRYCTAERTGETTLVLRIYSDSGRTSLLDTLAVSLTDAARYRYGYGCANANFGYTNPLITLDVEDLHYQEGGGTLYGTATVAAVSTVSAAGSIEAGASATIAAASGLAAAASMTYNTSATIAAQSALSAVAGVMKRASATIAAVSTVSARGKTPGSGTIAAVSTVTAAGSVIMRTAALIAAQSALSSPPLIQTYPVSISIPDLNGTRRRLSWGSDDDVMVVLDGSLYHRASGGFTDVEASRVVRQWIQVLDELPDTPNTPYDRVRLDWTDTSIYYVISRRPSGGDWTEIGTIHGLQFTDGPLLDGTWQYKVVAMDAQGDASLAPTHMAEAVVSSAPEPPSGLEFSWDEITKTLTLSWTASTSADVASYPVRSNAGSGPILLAGAPVQDTGALTYVQVFTTETGLWLFSVHAKDSDGIEEANVSQIIALSFESGVPTALPAWPLRVKADAIAGGKVRVSFWYRPDQEYLGPGAAFEARIYYDNGTGTVSYAAPLDTLAMSNPEDPAVWSWDSDALVDDQEYLFVVRIATAASPAGVETDNVDEHAATPNSDVPDAPVLTATVV